MAGNDELFKAMEMFKTGVKELAFSRALASANDEVQQIKSSELSEQEKRAQLSNLSNRMVNYMAGQGVPATTIQQVSAALGPRTFSSPGAAAIEGALSGDQSLIDAASTADRAAQAGNIDQLKAQQTFLASENAKNRAHQLEVAGIKGEKKGVRPMLGGQVDKIQEFDVANKGLTGVFDKFKTNTKLHSSMGPVAGNTWAAVLSAAPGTATRAEINDFRAEAMRQSQAYRRAITGMAASIPEMKEMPIALPTPEDDPKSFEQKMQTLLRQGAEVRAMYLKNLNKAKFDVSGFDEDGSISTGKVPVNPGAPPAGGGGDWKSFIKN
jgi:hypothetical protein